MSFSQAGSTVTMRAENEFQLNQMLDILQKKLTKRGVDLAHMHLEIPVISGAKAEQEVTMQQGITTEIAKQIVKYIKTTKLKVQASIQSDQIRVSGVKRDDLQEVIALLRKEDFKLPLQFSNFRD